MNGQFRSYASEAEVTGATQPKRNWTTVGRYGLPAGDRRPVHEQVYLETVGSFLNASGKIRITFYNDRLYSVVFTPDDWVVLEGEMKRQGLLPSERYVEGNIKFMLLRHSNAPATVTWHDMRLARENSIWAEKYQGWTQQ